VLAADDVSDPVEQFRFVSGGRGRYIPMHGDDFALADSKLKPD